jgi:hypothetical protein
MTAKTGQDFTIYAGDDETLTFTVTDGTNPINLSAMSEITWRMAREPKDAPIVSKTKTGGAITLPGTGTDGKFRVAISAADTRSLHGFYVHLATVTDAGGNLSTVATGRIEVGP